MKPIELSILFFADDNSELEKLGIETKEDDYVMDKMTFYTINAIAPHYEYDKDFCSIYSNGDDFICIDNYETVKQKISKNL